MIRIEQLTKRYGDTTVLDIPALEIPEGQIFGLVGNNGAGKTTLFSLFLDLIQATEGTVTINGIEVHRSEEWKAKTAAFLDDSFLIGYLTPEEYFYFIGELRGVSKPQVDELMDSFSDFFNDEILNQKKYIRDLSKGNQKKVGVVATFIGDPELLVLDEPFANLDPTTQIRLKELLVEKGKDIQKTILISSHDIQHVTEVCERIAVLEKGTIVQDHKTSAKTQKELEAFFSNQT